MPLILGANSVSGGYEVDNSLRFNSGSSDYLSRTPASAGNRQKFTYSTWIKRSDLPIEQGIISCESVGPITFYFYLKTDGVMEVLEYNGTYPVWLRTGPRTFRDVSAWYHLVLAYDTTQATSSNRVKLYINGSQNTTFDVETYPSQNYNSQMNRAIETNISRRVQYNAYFFNGYMSEIYFIDGQQLDPTYFGETDQDTNIWKPKAYTGSFGTNGFYLEFQNSGALGTDSSGNGNTFTVNNLTSIDQTTDTPTNNFATNNSLNYTPSAITYTEGNLKLAFPASWNASISSIGVSAGKWYWEAKAVTAGNNIFYGIMTENATTNTATPYTQIGVLCGKTTDGDKYLDTTYTASGYGTSANGDILGFALDLNSGTKNLTITKNGASFTGGSVNLSSNFNSVNVFAFFAGNSSSASAGWEVNYGSPMYSSGSYTDGAGYGNFSYAVPSGYYSLNTKNLADYG